MSKMCPEIGIACKVLLKKLTIVFHDVIITRYHNAVLLFTDLGNAALAQVLYLLAEHVLTRQVVVLYRRPVGVVRH